jgi:DNA mismatch repair protein MutS
MDNTGRIEEPAADAVASRATPVMAQFLEIKAANPGSLLFYRMGDFYELFFEDAQLASRDLGITLTKRGKHRGEDIPMCGVPVHAADAYLQKLIRLGHKVAVCEQLEDPAEARKRGSKSVLRRDVTRLVTPGTITEENLLESRSHNFLLSVTKLKGSGDIALAWADISSGDLAVMSSDEYRLSADLARLDAREIIVADKLMTDPTISTVLDRSKAPITPMASARFDSISAERRLKEHFGVAALEGFGSFSKAEIAALGGLLDYIVTTQAGRLPHLRQPRRELPGAVLLIDPATRANLELVRTLGGDKRGSVVSVIDFTMTAAGSRCLSDRLSNPILDPMAISTRLDDVSHFFEHVRLREDVRETLSRIPDIDRSLGRLAVGRGGPRDLAAIRDGLKAAVQLAVLLSLDAGIGGPPTGLSTILATIREADTRLIQELEAALADDLPNAARDGGTVSPGYSPELDENRALRDETRQVIAGLQSHYAGTTDIKTLKVRHNNVLGYFIEIPAQAASVLQSAEHVATFIHRQTVASAMRFTTTELASLDERIAVAADRALAIEVQIFNDLVTAVCERRELLSGIAAALASLDVSSSLAELAERRRYVRPRIDDSQAFVIKGGRHPVVEAALQDSATGSFVANDCNLSEDGKRLWLLTGPNMAGKSTYLRQNALMVILAQMGSFVPADEAHIGTVDRLFSRVGAADDLARGRSTFMVEMVETAAILNQATERSFVILDEIGRGTSTFDGLSIAWATVENLHGVNACRALFATHYHELTTLAARLQHLANATVKVRDWQDDIVFLHEVVPGVADRSYGIHVARLAGLPSAVIDRAQEILKRLERGDSKANPAGMMEELPLFAVQTPRNSGSRAEVKNVVEERLSAVTPDELSPREALAILYELKSLQAKT